MPFDFQFRIVESRRDLDRLIEFLRTQDLNYPGYQDWIPRTRYEIDIGYKTAGLATSSGIVVGDVIWQPHKELRRVREIKNLRVHPLVRNRYGGRFLMKQPEAESPETYDELILDFREDHPDKIPLIKMLMSMGYQKIQTVNLYDPNVRDIVMIKRKAA